MRALAGVMRLVNTADSESVVPSLSRRGCGAGRPM